MHRRGCLHRRGLSHSEHLVDMLLGRLQQGTLGLTMFEVSIFHAKAIIQLAFNIKIDDIEAASRWIQAQTGGIVSPQREFQVQVSTPDETEIKHICSFLLVK